MSRAPVDTLVSARWVVPMAADAAPLADAAVAIAGGRIVAVGRADELAARFSAAEAVSLPDAVLIPGFVNAHTHAAMTLLRGYADDLPLMRWLEERIWPAEIAHASPEFVYDGTLAAAFEMLSGGITCANDMYFYPDAAAQAFIDAGMRASVGIIAIEFPTRYASDADDYLAKGLATRDRFRDDPLISFALAPHAPYTVSDATFKRIATIAEELDLQIHCHVHETADEIARGLAEHGARPLERLRALGVVSHRLAAVHAVHLTDAERRLLAEHGASVVHCPSSNMKLASGFAPVAALAAEGVNLALGTDGAASNNRLDIFTEMRTAALLAKAVSGDATALPAHAALAAATLGGARALGLESRIGSLEPGKAADLVAVSLGATRLQPCYDPISHLVYACGREDITNVWVDGRSVVSAQRPVRAIAEQVAGRVCVWQNKLVS